MKEFSYNEILESVKDHYFNHMTYLNFSFKQTTMFLLDYFDEPMRLNCCDRLIVYTVLAKFGIGQNELIENVRQAITEIIKDNLLDKYKGEFSLEEFSIIKADLERIRDSIRF